MDDVPRHLGPVQRVEMQMFHSAFDQPVAKLRAMGRREKLRPVVADRGVEIADQFLGNAGATALGEAAHAFPVLDRQNARDDRSVDAGRRAGVTKPEERLGLEEELRDRRGCTRVDLALEPVDIRPGSPRLRMWVRVGADMRGEAAGRQRLDELDRRGEAVGACREASLGLRWVAAQGHDVGHPGGAVAFGDLEGLFPGGVDAGEVGRHLDAPGLADGLDRLVGQSARRAACAVSHRDEVGAEGCQHPHGLPEPERGFEGFRREELERDRGAGHGRRTPYGMASCLTGVGVRQIHNLQHHHQTDFMHIEFRHLRTIKAIHDAGGLARAADVLNITQSALSHQIKGLEEQAGVELFVRRTKPLKLSAAGQRLLRAAERILPEIAALEDEFAGLRDGKSGRLHIAIECHACFEWLFPVLEEFRKAWPEVDVDIRPGLAFDALPALQREDVDIVISSDPERLPGIEFTPLFDYEPVFVAASAHPLAAKRFVDAEDFRGETLIAYPVERARLDVFTELLTPAKVEPTAVILLLVASNRGVAVLPDWVVREVRTSSDYVTRPLTSKGVTRRLYAATRSEDRPLPYMAHVLRLAATLPVRLQRGEPLTA